MHNLPVTKLSVSEFFVDTIQSLKNKIMWFQYYRKTFKNFLIVLKHELNSDYPFQAVLRNGNSVIINSRDKAALYALLSTHDNFVYDEKTDSINFHYETLHGKHLITLFGITQNLDAILAFSDNATYEKLPIQNKTVVDIGACTGDTSIYFALNGSSKVIALEPYPKNFEMAVKNVKTNNLENIISVVLGGCGKSGSVVIDPSYQSSMRSVLQRSETGVTIPIFTLERILNEFDIVNPILKLDCEGCEYETILNSPKEVLLKFSHIQIEYHNGYQDIKRKLEGCGFKVTKLFSDNSKRGHILATRK